MTSLVAPGRGRPTAAQAQASRRADRGAHARIRVHAGGGGWLLLIGVGALVDTAVALALPAVLGQAVDTLVAGTAAGTTGDPAASSSRWLLLAAGLVTAGIAADLVRALAGTAHVAGTTARWRNRLVRHVLAVGPAATRQFNPGDLVSRVSGNAAEAAQAGPHAVLAVVAALPPVGSLACLALVDPWLAVAAAAGLAGVVAVLRTFTRRSGPVLAGYQQVQGRLAARLAEALAGARTIAAARSIAREERRVLEPLPDLREHGRQTWREMSRAHAQAAVAGPLVLVAVLAVGGLGVVDGRVTAGELLAASRYAVLSASLGGLTGILAGLTRARAGRRRIEEVLALAAMHHGRRTLPAAAGTASPEGPVAALVALPGRLELRDVTVYGQAPQPDGSTLNILLDRVTMTLPGGATVAVVGRSGAGKSVLADLAARLRDPDRGEVRLDGVPLGELDRAALREAVGYAFERPVLFGGTVADAVGLGLSRRLVQAAARASGAHGFVSRLPQQYDTPLAQAPLSGGEAQRLGLARAWHATRLLVLDDATASLDMVTEMQVNQTLTADHGRRTLLVVTHRVTTAARSDLVVWLAAGRVRAVQPHRTLWADPEYRSLFG